MAGPVAGVLLPSPLTSEERECIQASVSLESGHLIEAYFPGHDAPAIIHEFTAAHRARVAERFGMSTADEIHLYAVVSGPESHRLLAQIAAGLAERFGGIIDFDGALWPPTPGDEWRGHDNTEWFDIEREVTAILGELPGRLIALPYQTGRDTQWAVHYGDARFLRAWLQHPQFHMIK